MRRVSFRRLTRSARRTSLAATSLLVLAGCGASAGHVAAPAALVNRPPTGQAPAGGVAYGSVTPWPAALHDARHSGSSSAAGPSSGTILWSRRLGAPVLAGAVLGADGTIYDSASNGVLHAIDPATGRDEWVYDAHGSTNNGEDLSTSALVMADGTIVWPGPRGILDGLDRQGHLLWQARLSGTVLSPVQGPGNRIYVADSRGDLEALNVLNGRVRADWKIHDGHPKFSFGSPAVGPGGVVYTTSDNELVAVHDEGSKAAVAWRFAAKAPIEVAPSVAPDGTVVLGTNDPYEYGIRPSGAVAWRVRRRGFSYSTPAVTAGGLAYFGSNDGFVYAVASRSGRPLGAYGATTRALSPNGVGVWTAPLVDSRHDVYFGTASGHILGFSYDGRRLFDIATGGTVASYPALSATGTLIIGSDDGTLYAVGHG